MTLIEELKEAMYAYDNSCDLYQGMYIGLQEAIDIVKAHNSWKPASQPPEEDGRYQVTVVDLDGTKYVDEDKFQDGKWKYDTYKKVLAWQPLPEPYEGE